ncbi:CLIP domain-containing serine protease B4-like [Anopheles gambiae]|uniref:CLIP domain-containing serine protease B4-like n=1 Tax=Anopheles gambiae TaxID=7165 RepID=UPI002AC90FD3|nr:CLIP domain-containing serine protease B4-like [Anopheles gambiae]
MGLKLHSIFVIVEAVVTIQAVQTEYTSAQPKPGAFCINPAGEPGKCISIRECEPLLHVLLHKAEVSAKERTFLIKSRCSMHERQPWVCCAGPPPDEQNPLPSPPHCGVRTNTRLIGSQFTQLDDYPWTALIEYEKPDGSTGFHCGGTLINQGHILTAAHCVSTLPAGWKVHGVRLGEWDLSEALDCELNYCNNAPVDLKISKIMIHEGYDALNGSSSHDIALIRFEQQVNFSDTIKPICLPLAESIRSKNMTDGISTVVGWGKSQSSAGVPKRLKLNLNVSDYRVCSALFVRPEEVQPSQLCALREESNNELCSADSGAGLERFFYGFQYLTGIAGSGEHKCGRGNIPSLFVCVLDYVEWIQEKVREGIA